MKKGIKAIITGKVQMVTFRDFAKRKADNLGIYGTVENLPDGSVRIIAQGEEENLKEFIEELKVGPQYGEIESINVEWKEIGENLLVGEEGFKIIWK